MNELPYISDPGLFQVQLKSLHELREQGKQKEKRKYALPKRDRELILAKTDSRCHVCGEILSLESFEADHVKSHSKGGTSSIDNFLPACSTCNNYRWDYLPEEFKWILKLGIWARTEIEKKTIQGREIARKFITTEITREKRRKSPRAGKTTS